MAYTKNKSKSSVFQGLTGLAKSIQTDKGQGQIRSEFYELEPAEVIDVILDDKHPKFQNYTDIGSITARPCFSEYDAERSILKTYKPLDMNIKDYPVVGEYVIVAEYFTQKFYTRRLNLSSTVNNGVQPGKSFNLANNDKKTTSVDSYKKNNSTGIAKGDEDFYKKLFDEYPFLPRIDLAPVEQKLGDITFNGRYGQSIKFGASGEREEAYTSPNMIFKVGQRLDATEEEFDFVKNGLKPIKEDINLDGTSMMLTTLEEVSLIPATIDSDVHYQRFKDNVPEKFDGKQIILNSDRLIFNTKKSQFMCFSKLSQYFCTEEKYIVDSLLGVNINSPAPIIISTENKTVINSPEIYLGATDEENPSQDEPIVKGETLKGLLEELIDLVTKTQFINGAGPASMNPGNIAQYTAIKSKLTTILSTQNYTI